MDLEELGAFGGATVTRIGPCPPFRPGTGAVVTGKFAHEADENSQVVRLRLEGQAEEAGVTANHPYWSIDRGDFVPVGDLAQGELVSTDDGPRRVVAITPDPDYRGYLYNIETTEHVYLAGPLGTLVHNSCGLPPRDALGRFTKGAGGNTAYAARGRQAHKSYRNAHGEGYAFEVKVGEGLRADAVNVENRIVRELKPNNPRAIQQGRRQLEQYRKALEQKYGGTWKSFLDTYTP